MLAHVRHLDVVPAREEAMSSCALRKLPGVRLSNSHLYRYETDCEVHFVRRRRYCFGDDSRFGFADNR